MTTRLQCIISHLKPLKASNITYEYVFITGCSRGIGYGFVKAFLTASDTYFVVASCRSPNKATELKLLLSQYSNRSMLIRLDTSNEDSIINACNKIKEKQINIDILINNAAIVSTIIASFNESVVNFSSDEMKNVFNVNLIGVALIFKYLFNNNLLNKNGRIINMTTNVASLTKDTGNNYTSYRLSKTCVNMLTVLQQSQIGNQNSLKICCIDPGHVQTKMGLQDSGFTIAPLTVQQSCNGIIKIIQKMKTTNQYNGKFVKYNGTFMQF